MSLAAPVVTCMPPRALHTHSAPVVAFKALVAGNASQASGAYSFYQDSFATTIGGQVAAPGAGSFTSWQQCLDACSADNACAGIVIMMLIDEAARPTSCSLIYGMSAAAGTDARSFVRAEVSQLTVPPLT